MIRLVRHQEAIRQLLEGQAAIKEIGWRTGYHTAAGFSRVFKQISGMSPAEFRRSRQADASRSREHRGDFG
jgi:AraC-like DNA-binding protein